MATGGATCNATKRLLKCFCGCSDLTEEEVKRIYRLNAQGTLIDRQALVMLRRFLEQARSGEKGDAEQYLDIYEKCDAFLKQSNSILTLDELDELCELGLPYHLERDLKRHILTGMRNEIDAYLLRIQGECRNNIECSTEFKQYKHAVLDKLRQRNEN